MLRNRLHYYLTTKVQYVKITTTTNIGEVQYL